jgi:hypothetical protein
VWIGHVIVPYSVEIKLRNRRGLTGAQIRAACEWPARVLDAAWHDHPAHGRRLLVQVRDEENRLLDVVLQPIDVTDGTWLLRTAFESTKKGAP